VGGSHVLRVGDLDQARLRKVPAGRSPPLPETPPHREGRDQPHLLQLSHPVLAPSERAEAEARDLVGGEDLVLEQQEQDMKISLVDRARARAILVSFCSNHDSGTALPPPSGRGLRRKGPVTWPFALPRPARSRRPRAVSAACVGQRDAAPGRVRALRLVDRSSVRARAHLPPRRSHDVLRSPAELAFGHPAQAPSRFTAFLAGAPVPFARRPSARTGLPFTPSAPPR
jgi:hypothetical protein